MTLTELARKPAKAWHIVMAVAAGGGLVLGAARWMGMPNWGPAVSQAQIIQRIDSTANVHAIRDSTLAARSARIEDRHSADLDTIRRRMDGLQMTNNAALRLLCTMTSQRDQRLAQVACP